MKFYPRYIKSHYDGLLDKKIKLGRQILKRCTLCPRNCLTNRLEDKQGFCQTGKNPIISSYMPHYGEEPQISGFNGSGTIFFSQCNLKCCFCQNHEISLSGQGHQAQKGQLAAVMLQLQKKGCHNINLVTPTHVVPQLLEDLTIAIDHGLTLPIVYNSSGYESIDTLRLLDGIVDIYMPDFKFWDPKTGEAVCNAPDYPQVAKKAVLEMHRQVGDLITDSRGIAQTGLLVRHLIMPEGKSGTASVMNFLKTEVSAHIHVNIMSQYHPAGKADKILWLSRPVTVSEYRAALKIAADCEINII